MARELIKTRRYKAGYEVRYERLTEEDAADGPPTMHTSAWAPDGHYIGNTKFAHRLVAKRGIKPELAGPNGCGGHVCSIGFCKHDQKWYGWSHRALHGFGIGDTVDSEDHLCACSGYIDEYIAEHPELDQRLPVGFVAKTLADCRRMAVAFAEAVG